jgi:tetratricopeptide (TPR) repeat protein
MSSSVSPADSDLMRLAQEKAFEDVLAAFKERPPGEVLAVADWLREDDIYNVAIELYAWLLEVDPSAAAEFGIGQCYGKIYDYDKSLAHLDRAFEGDPERSDGASYYAYILERHERMEDADRWYRQALAGAEADDLWARSHYAWFLEKWGRDDDACNAFADVLERNPMYTWASKRYALLVERLGRHDDALAVIRAPMEQAPANKFAALNYLEFLLISDDPGYADFRASLDTAGAPAWYPVVVDLYDYYRDNLLPGNPDPERLEAIETAAGALKDSVHRDFDDLTAKLTAAGGDVDTWKREIQLLLK